VQGINVFSPPQTLDRKKVDGFKYGSVNTRVPVRRRFAASSDKPTRAAQDLDRSGRLQPLQLSSPSRPLRFFAARAVSSSLFRPPLPRKQAESPLSVASLLRRYSHHLLFVLFESTCFG